MKGRPAEFQSLIDASRRAISRLGAQQISFELAGRLIRIEAAGGQLLERLAPAFEHLPQGNDQAAADLTILAWDTASTGEPLPSLGNAIRPGHEVASPINDPRHSLAFQGFEGSLSYLDHDEALAVYAVEDASRVPPWERACPLRAILTWWFTRDGKLLAHGAAVGSESGALLIVGKGGSGKSTTSLTCFASGMGYAGDDYVLLDPATGMVHSVYGSSKLSPETLERFPGLVTPEPVRPEDPEGAKRIGWPGRVRPEAMLKSAPVGAILMPEVTGAATCQVRPTGSSRALLALAPTTMFQTPGDKTAAFNLSARFVTALPAYRLELGGEMEKLPAQLSQLLNRANSR